MPVRICSDRPTSPNFCKNRCLAALLNTGRGIAEVDQVDQVDRMRLTNSVFLRHHKDDSGDVLIALTQKGLSGGEVPIRDSLVNWQSHNSESSCKDQGEHISFSGVLNSQNAEGAAISGPF
jgi:hypothetical protein